MRPWQLDRTARCGEQSLPRAAIALFTDGSYKITDTLTFSTGVRWFRYLSQQQQQEWGDFINGSDTPPTPTTTKASDNGFNPRFNLSYSPDANLTTYISATKGFRPGGANQYVPPPNIPLIAPPVRRCLRPRQCLELRGR